MTDRTQDMTKVYEHLHNVNQQMFDIWFHQVLFTWRWWLGVGLTLGPWFLWYLVRPRGSSARILYAVLPVMLIVSWLDFIGSGFLGLWHYYYEVVPFVPAYIPWDLAMIPVLIALALQYKPAVWPLVKALAVGLLFAYVGEPLFTSLKMYEPERWRHYYSLLIMMVIYLLAHYHSKASQFDKIEKRS